MYGSSRLLFGFLSWQFPHQVNSLILNNGSNSQFILRSLGIRQMALGGGVILVTSSNQTVEENCHLLCSRRTLLKIGIFVDIVELMNVSLELRKREMDWKSISLWGVSHFVSALVGGLLLFADDFCKK